MFKSLFILIIIIIIIIIVYYLFKKTIIEGLTTKGDMSQINEIKPYGDYISEPANFINFELQSKPLMNYTEFPSTHFWKYMYVNDLDSLYKYCDKYRCENCNGEKPIPMPSSNITQNVRKINKSDIDFELERPNDSYNSLQQYCSLDPTNRVCVNNWIYNQTQTTNCKSNK